MRTLRSSHQNKRMSLVERVRGLNLPAGTYAVFGSGPLDVRGIREAHDIDIIVTHDQFRKIAADMSWQTKELADHHSSLEKDGVSIYHTWAPGSWDLDELIKDADMIDGLPFVELRSILEWKRMRNSTKDQHDVLLIEDYLAKHQ